MCCDILKGASDRPEQFNMMIPALREQFREGCEFREVRLRMGDRGQGITFLVKLDKDAGWCRHKAAMNGMAGTVREEGKGCTRPIGPTRMTTWEATKAIRETVEPRRQDTDWGREVVYLVRLHPVGVTKGPKT